LLNDEAQRNDMQEETLAIDKDEFDFQLKKMTIIAIQQLEQKITQLEARISKLEGTNDEEKISQ
jgi:TolA-binding protein